MFNQEDIGGYTRLHYAVILGSIELVKNVLMSDVKVDALSHKGETSYYCALASGQKEIAELLIEHGAKPEHALLGAVLNRNVALIRQLISFGAEKEKAFIYLLSDRNFDFNKDLPILEWLLKEGIAINRYVNIYAFESDYHDTILHTVACHGYYQVLELLARHATDKLDVNHKIRNQALLYTLISRSIALKSDYRRTIEKYQSNVPEINIENIPEVKRYKRDIKAYEKTMKLLIMLGADLDNGNDDNRETVWDLIASHQQLTEKINKWIQYKSLIQNDNHLLTYLNNKQQRRASVGGFFALFNDKSTTKNTKDSFQNDFARTKPLCDITFDFNEESVAPQLLS